MNVWALVSPQAPRNVRAQVSAASGRVQPRGLGGRVVIVGPKRPPQLRRGRAQSKNCTNNKKEEVNAKKRKREEEKQAARSARQLEEQIRELDRRLTLMKGRAVVARQNAQAAALNTMSTYYRCMSRGFDPVHAPEQARETESFLRSTFAHNLKTPDFTGLDHLMKQWELLSMYHASVVCNIEGVEIMDASECPRIRRGAEDESDGEDEDDEVHVVKTYGVTALEISRATIESVFPHILANEPLVQSLIGKTYSFAFTLFAYVSARDGRVFQIESKIDLTSALLDLLQDPFATIQMVNNTTMNKRGNLLLRSDVREDQNVIENGFL